jgi:hypothetical protein
MTCAEGTRRLLAATLLALALAACQPRERSTPAPEPAPKPPAVPVLPVPPPALGRAELLRAVAEAADASAAGREYPQGARQLEGRRFALRLPFGCGGPSASAEPRLGYELDARRGTLRLAARPEVWTDAGWARALVGGGDVESIEGFWLSRPWTSSEACPPLPAVAAAPPTPETVGLAQTFAEGGSRLLRRGDRPYEATVKLEEGQPPAAGGFRLALEGRIVAGADGRTVACLSGHPDQRPVCLVRVELDRVAFEDPAGATLAEWKS